ncbi:MAG: hypothetical protein H6658_10460 [Ardenticatenaceae bacterium]|nr:hypothetical protein [Ardenticatenaceae bacterium]
MTQSCPNCNQTVLPTDTVCWQCGYRLTKQPAAPKARPDAPTAVAPAEPFSLSAVMVYGGVTAVLVIFLLLTMRGLGKRPLVFLHPDTNVNTGWLPVTDQSLQFTLDIPPTWHSFDKQDPAQRQALADLLAEEAAVAGAVVPLDTAVTDMEIVMVMMAEQVETTDALPGFVVVAQSKALGRLSSDEVVQLVGRETAVTVTEVNRFRSFLGDNRLSLLLEMPPTSHELTCQQHIIYSQTGAFLLAGCAPANQYAVYREPLEKILGSFQPLR